MHEHQPTIWDWAASEAAKQAGIDQAGENKKQLLEYARGIARELARGGKVISADDVQLEIENRGISVHALGSAAGSLFKGKEWQWTGQFIKSQRVHSHSNLLRTWRLRDAA